MSLLSGWCTWSHGCMVAPQLWIKGCQTDFPATSPPKRWCCAMSKVSESSESSTQEVSEWVDSAGPLRRVGICLRWAVQSLWLVILVGCHLCFFVGSKLDCWITPHRTLPEWNCDDVPFLDGSRFNEGHSYIDARIGYLLHNNVTLQNAPRSCQLIHATDVASSTSKAQQCAAWCEEQHLSQSAVLFAGVILTDNKTITHGRKLFTTCFKAEMAAVVGTYIPNKWLAGLLYRLVGLMPAALLLWRSKPDDGADDETQSTNPPDRHPPCKRDGPFPDGDLGFPWNITVGCCWRPTTDFIAARFHLAKSAFSVVTEPLFDAISVFTFLKNGQPFYFAGMIYGLTASFAWSGDGLQSGGALALVPSWRRGFATKDLLQHRLSDLPECFISTCIQLYAALSLSWSQDPCNVVQLGMFAWMSILLTLPEATTVIIVLPRFGMSERLWNLFESRFESFGHLRSLFVQQGGVNVDDFYEVENAKKQIGIRRYILSIVLVAFTQAGKNLLNGNLEFCYWAWFGEFALVLLAFACHCWTRQCSDSHAEVLRYIGILYVWTFSFILIAPFPTYLHHFVTLLESIREIPWTWPLLWPHWPWPVPEIRWDILAPAMHIFNHIAGVLLAFVSSIDLLLVA